MRALNFIVFILCLPLLTFCETEPDTTSLMDFMEIYKRYTDSIESTFHYQTGLIQLKDNTASIQVPEGFKYLGPEDSERVLTDIWGNPPSDGENKSWGMLFPTNGSPLADSSFAINITYAPEGYIKDDDAKDLDYDDLLKTMKSDISEANQYRIEAGYEPIELVGWASAPFYDSQTKKLHWAKELKFGEATVNTLNYNIRILGRKGYLELNAISDINNLNQVKSNINPILESVNFNDGNRYADFNPKMDKVAAYGIGGLIAGKLLLKAGLFAKLGLILAKFWKVIALGFIAIMAGVRKLFSKKEESVQ